MPLNYMPKYPDCRSLSSVGHIDVYHPAYEGGYGLFLTLPCFPDSSNTTTSGLLKGILLDACLVLANCRDGFLSTSQDPEVADAKIDDERDVLVPPGHYYYHVPDL